MTRGCQVALILGLSFLLVPTMAWASLASLSDPTEPVCVLSEALYFCYPKPVCTLELGPADRPPCNSNAVADGIVASEAADERAWMARAGVPSPFRGGLFDSGFGTLAVQRAAGSTTCLGSPRMVLEASSKPGGLEPTVSFAFGGGRADRAASPFMLPCMLGHSHQPVRGDVIFHSADGFGGAWSASHEWGSFRYTLDVDAPYHAPGIFRHVHYEYYGADGSRDTFDGTLAEVLRPN